jgi:hypothetical protein
MPLRRCSVLNQTTKPSSQACTESRSRKRRGCHGYLAAPCQLRKRPPISRQAAPPRGGSKTRLQRPHQALFLGEQHSRSAFEPALNSSTNTRSGTCRHRHKPSEGHRDIHHPTLGFSARRTGGQQLGHRAQSGDPGGRAVAGEHRGGGGAAERRRLRGSGGAEPGGRLGDSQRSHLLPRNPDPGVDSVRIRLPTKRPKTPAPTGRVHHHQEARTVTRLSTSWRALMSASLPQPSAGF